MRWIVTARAGGAPLHVSAAPEERILDLPVDMDNVPNRISHNAWEMLERHQIHGTPSPVVDLFRLAAAVFSTDLRAPRRTAFDRWTREIHLHLQVTDADLWNAAKQEVVDLLGFLSGDRWEVIFQPGGPGRPEPRNRRRVFEPLEATATCLLSGGLDSFIGASDALASGERLYLVSHNAQGSAAHSNAAQQRVLTSLESRYGAGNLRHIRFVVSPPPTRVSGGGRSRVQRVRPILPRLSLHARGRKAGDVRTAPPVRRALPHRGERQGRVPGAVRAVLR
jgi:hypothetical protein